MEMSKNSFIYKAFHLYYDGFREMTVGKTLWAVVLVKLFIMFVILKLLFFPNYVSRHAEKGEEAEFVSEQVLERADNLQTK
jgi:hypothetical protein